MHLYAKRFPERVIDPLRIALEAEEMVCGGQARKGCSLDLGLSEGVAAEQQWRTTGGDEAWFGVGVRDPAVAPPGQGGLDDGGREVGAEVVAGERDHGAYNLYLVVFEVRATPLWAGVDHDGRGFADALTSVVADPVKRLALDLHSSWLRNTGRTVEQHHKGEARVIRDRFEVAPGAIRQTVAPEGGKVQRLRNRDREHERVSGHPQARLARDLPATVGIVDLYSP